MKKLEAGITVKRGTGKLTTVKLALPKPAEAVHKLAVTYAARHPCRAKSWQRTHLNH